MKGCEYTIHGDVRHFKHQLTHQTLYAVFYTIHLEKIARNSLLQKDFTFIKQGELHKYSVPRLIDRFLQVVEKEKTVPTLPLI